MLLHRAFRSRGSLAVLCSISRPHHTSLFLFYFTFSVDHISLGSGVVHSFGTNQYSNSKSRDHINMERLGMATLKYCCCCCCGFREIENDEARCWNKKNCPQSTQVEIVGDGQGCSVRQNKQQLWPEMGKTPFSLGHVDLVACSQWCGVVRNSMNIGKATGRNWLLLNSLLGYHSRASWARGVPPRNLIGFVFGLVSGKECVV